MNLLGPRQRKALRCSLYACTILALILIAISIWVEPYYYSKSATKTSGVSRGFSLVLSDGVLMSAYWKEQPALPEGFATRISGIGKHGALLPAWYAPPNFQPGYIKLPLAYLAAFFLVASAVVFYLTRRTHPDGCCASCGYSLQGIESHTCPDCGNREHA